MKIETVLIAIFLCSLTFLGFYSFITDTGNIIGVDVNSDIQKYNTQANNTRLSDAFNKINETKAKTDAIANQYNDASLDSLNSLFSFGILSKNIGSLILNSGNTVKEMTNIITEIIGIPPEIVDVFVSIVILLIVLSLIYLFLGVVKD